MRSSLTIVGPITERSHPLVARRVDHWSATTGKPGKIGFAIVRRVGAAADVLEVHRPREPVPRADLIIESHCWICGFIDRCGTR